MKKMDFILIVCLLLVAGVLYFSGILRPGEEGALAVIMVDGKEIQSLPLNKDTVFSLNENGNTNTVVIKDGYANVTEANCPDKICVDQRKIHLQGETIVCLPHKMVVEIKGGMESDVDGVSG